MPMYNLIEYNGNYSDTSGSLWGFKKDEIDNNAGVTNDNNAPHLNTKQVLLLILKKWNRVKIAVPLKYLSNFWRSLEMPLINCKIELSLKWIENCVLTSAPIGDDANAAGTDSATFKITYAKLYVPIVTLSAEDNGKLLKLLGEGFKRFIYWNKYKDICIKIDNTVVQIATANEEKHIRALLDPSYQGVKRWFVLAYDNTAGNNKVSIDSFKKYFLTGVKIENYNIEIDGRNFF